MNKDNVKLVIVLIGWINDDMLEFGSENIFQQIVSEMVLVGFIGSEVGSKYLCDLVVFKLMLDICGIQICNVWFSIFFVNGQWEKIIDEFVNYMNFFYVMGVKVIGCFEQSGSIQGLDKLIFGDVKLCFSDEEWQWVVEGYNIFGCLVVEKGMQVCLYYYMGIGIQIIVEIDKFMLLVDECVFLLFDIGYVWYFEGGEVLMLVIFKKYLLCINYVYLKDVCLLVIDQVCCDGLLFFDGVKKGIFIVLGDGVIDFCLVFKLLDDFGYKGWMVVEVEQDFVLVNFFEYVVKVCKYICEMVGI